MIGKILGKRYTILEEINEGGMAIVYKARCNLLNRIVAVKILKAEFSDDADFVRRFRREAQAAASLCHPNIVGIYDVGEEDNLYYIVMEYVEGKTLKEVIKEEAPLPPSEVIDIGIQICDALESAHKNKIVHRDIKSQNIMVTHDGRIKVTDFGIARAASGTTITNTGNVFGTVQYFSPEQAKSDTVDERSDIYSFGIVLYEALTGQLPFDGDTPVSIALKQIQQRHKPISAIIPGFPLVLESIINRCMAKSPEERFQTAREIKDELKKLIDRPEIVNFKPQNMGETLVMTKLLDDEEIMIENRKAKKSRNKPYKKIAIALTLVALFGAFSILGAQIARKVFDSPEINVPRLIGYTEEEVERELKELGLKAEVVERVYDNAPMGEVIDQDPKPGEKIKANHPPIKLTVSRGPETNQVPALIGVDEQNARAMIYNDGFEVGSTTPEFSDKYPKGVVMYQTPKAGLSMPKGTKINLTISRGPEQTEQPVPVLIGRSLTEAEEILRKYKLKVKKVKSKPSDAPENTVIDQSPRTGELPEGGGIELVVSSGPIKIRKIPREIPLPSEPEEFIYKVEVSDDLGKRIIYQKKHTPEDSPLEIIIEGSGKIHVKGWLNDVLHYQDTLEPENNNEGGD